MNNIDKYRNSSEVSSCQYMQFGLFHMEKHAEPNSAGFVKISKMSVMVDEF